MVPMALDPPHQLCTQPFAVQDAEHLSRIIKGSLLGSSRGHAETVDVFSDCELSALRVVGSIPSLPEHLHIPPPLVLMAVFVVHAV